MTVFRWIAALFLTIFFSLPASAEPVLPRFLDKVPAGDLVPGADAYGALSADLPVVPVLRGGETVGWAFITSDFVSTTGYSGKPIDVLVAVGPDATVQGVKLVKHSEPIVLIGIPESEMRAVTEAYAGLDLVAEAESGGTAHELDIISGATVTVMVIDDSIVRAGLKVARALGLGGLKAAVDTGPKFELNPDAPAATDWMTLEGDGTLRRLSLDVGQINAAFEAMGNPEATRRALTEAPETTFIEMQAALVSHPAIAEALLGEAEARNIANWLEDGDHAIALVGRGLYSFKGSGYVRGGIFDRIVLIQDDISVRFRDRMHKRIVSLAAEGAPAFIEADLFKIPADSGFDPTQPFRIQLLVHREVGPIDKVFTTFDLGYQLPSSYLRPIAATQAADSPAAVNAIVDQGEEAAHQALWKRIWLDKQVEIAVTAALLLILTGVFFFQFFATRNERRFFWFRMTFLTVVLVYLGWYANAQLSVVNLMALFGALVTGFSWQAFLLDPLTFILWFAVAAALLFWGRGAYCGWLCPFGALQELTNKIARALRVPQWTLPWGLHERLWPIKYMIFLGLFGVSLASIEQAERLAEVEPFKTAIILNFMRAWPFVAYVMALLAAGLFVERFYCRYLCPLGAALAIPARMRMFDWLKRYKECGSPCQTCANQCPVQAIHPTGEINPNECVNCLHCQVLYQSKSTCPVVIKKLKRRETVGTVMPRDLSGHPNLKTPLTNLKTPQTTE
ncbi:NosR/NirI family protein [Thalassococcus sp. CAU 1522]|uniref:NosR/NirI family protein n=1 Tax=Thalassococcus arenae TaxID=2851652 RepID=A0ABS6NC40_9RHOB|nr:NosR/NirI family protein [Thalassococcus arenae]MBV2361580.1 NosR/NirI family protein [Thalassococcus arenae]